MKRLPKKVFTATIVFTLLFWIPHSYLIISGTNFSHNPNSISSSIHSKFKNYFNYKKNKPAQNAGERYTKYSDLPIETMIALDCIDTKSDYTLDPNSFIDEYSEIYPNTDSQKLYSKVTNSINNLFDTYSKESKKNIYTEIILKIFISLLFYFITFYISAIEFIKRK